MELITEFRRLTRDHVRMAQLFMLCRQVGVILSSIVIARSISIEQVGIFEMLMLCGYLMTFFWSDALLKGYLANPSGAMKEYDSASFLWFFILAAFISMGVLLIGQQFFLPLFVGRPTLSGLSLFVIYQACIIPLWIAPFIGVLKKNNAFFVSVYVLLGPSLACWFGFAGIGELHGVLVGLLIYAFVGLVWVILQTRFVRELNFRKLFVTLWPVTWPLAMYAISSGLARSFDLWLVAREFSDATFAFFRYGAREFPVVIAFAAGLSTVMIPKLKSQEALGELKMRSTKLMHYAYPLVAIVMFFSPVLFSWFFGDAYKASAIIFNVYLLLALTQFIFPQSILIAREQTKVLWYVSIAELVINIMASLILLKYYGLVGIAWGTLIAFVSEKIILLFLVYRRYHISAMALINPVIWILYTVLLVTTFIACRWIFGI
jgi:O-antigen/teichoic acid export membrane protein